MNAFAQYLSSTSATRLAMAGRLGVSHSMVSRWATGTHTPTLATALMIERITEGAVPVISWAKAEQDAA